MFEGAGSADPDVLAAGAELVERAARTWMIPVRIVTVRRGDGGDWTAAMAAAVTDVLSG